VKKEEDKVLVVAEPGYDKNRDRNGDYQKSNFLIGAKYKSSIQENKIIAIALSKIRQKDYEIDQGSIICKFKAKDLKIALGAEDNHSIYKKLDRISKNLTNRSVGWTDPKSNKFDYIAVVTRASYENGTFRIKFNQDLQEYIDGIRGNYTTLSLVTMLQFKNVYSFRLYEILRSKAYYRKGEERADEFFEITFQLSELRLLMGIVNANLDSVRNILLENPAYPDYDRAVEASPEKMYADWGDFKRHVIDVAVKEINKITDMAVEYKPKKGGKGGRVYGLIFYVQLHKDKHLNAGFIQGEQTELPLDVVEAKEVPKKHKKQTTAGKIELTAEQMNVVLSIARTLPADLDLDGIKAIAEAGHFDPDYIHEKYELSKTQDVDNLVAWMVAALRNDYQSSSVKAKKTRSKKRMDSDMEYDIDAIEARMLKN
jgi:plasmid replication initiation protein